MKTVMDRKSYKTEEGAFLDTFFPHNKKKFE